MRYQTIQAAVASAFLLAVGLAFCPHPAGAAEQCPLKVAKSRPLTGNVDCSGITDPTVLSQTIYGVEITKNGVMLDCNGYSIIGPDAGTSHGTKTKHYGIYVGARRKVTIKNCIKGSDSAASIADGTATGIKYWERGIYLENASVVTIDNNRLHHNTRYGGNATSDIDSKNKYIGYGGTWKNNYFSYNGDEGIHISGGGQTASARRLVLFNNFADHNVEEGFYFFQVGRSATPAVAGAMDFGCPTGGNARCNGGNAAGNEAHDNGSAGVYLKHSYLNNLTRIRLTNDNLQIVGSSASNTIDRVTITGGARVKFETKAEIPAGSSTCQDLIPYANTLKNICVTDSNDYSFVFEGVDTTQVGANVPNVIGAISGVSSSDSKSASPDDNAVRGQDCPFSATACSTSADDCIHSGGLGSRGNTITAFASGAHQGVTNDPNSNLTLTTSGTSNPICY